MFSGLLQVKVDEVVDTAISNGINFFDVAPTYGDAEIKLGNALEGKRKNILLSCKTTRRDRNNALSELRQSMKNLKTDYFDFYVMHGIRDVEKDVQSACSKNGMLELAIEVKKQGIVRRIGFSAHTEEAAIAALNKFDFDFIMFPINIFCFLKVGFGEKVLEAARKRNVDVIGIKCFALQKWKENSEKSKYPNCWYQPIEDIEIAKIAFSWAVNKGIVSIIPPADVEVFCNAIKIARMKLELKQAHLARIKKIVDNIEPIFP
ncbi:MAG: aldo/keto reductase [Candidatus Omnitrophica bacterium]|nr:aldo/keto reductase [Candidatus Omnitrophota bacterium]